MLAMRRVWKSQIDGQNIVFEFCGRFWNVRMCLLGVLVLMGLVLLWDDDALPGWVSRDAFPSIAYESSAQCSNDIRTHA